MRRWGAGFLITAISVAGPIHATVPLAGAITAISAAELERRSSARTLADLLRGLPCAAHAIPTFARSSAAPNSPGVLTCLRPADLRMVEIYRLHNATRAHFGAQPLVWDPELAQGALGYSRLLPSRGLVHSPRAGRGAARENLLRARRGRVVVDLGATWIAERRWFRPGIFPNVSTNGNWASVSHYTQMVWPTTTRIGCGITSDRQWDWLVCRYLGPGNRDGTYIGPIGRAR
jgi:hypothetical protein